MRSCRNFVGMTISPAGVIPEWTRGDRLRKAREVTGMTTRQFAEHIGVSTKTISDAENDKRQMRKILLNAWALATGVPAEWLEHGTLPTSGPDGGPGGQESSHKVVTAHRRVAGQVVSIPSRTNPVAA